ncbi:MAG TPA: FemAB family PEP-CTERM system-associated protein [Gammaproteobacteria bacterium]|nr:FemAB family PEP-CTERM system-associated protein [Gammaproteobacteria bacterium]
MSQLQITELLPQEAPLWNDYLRTHPNANFYQRAEWKTINETEFGHRCAWLVARQAGRIRGLFPLVEIRSRLFGHMQCSLPFVNFGAPCADARDIEQALVEHACARARGRGVDYLEIRAPRELPVELPVSRHKISMSLELDPDPEVLWNAFKSKHRTNIRRVYKHDIEVRSGGGELLDDFYRVMAHSWRALGTPLYRKRYFARIIEAFGEDVRLFVAERNGQVIATAFNGHHQDTVEGMWAGALPEARGLQVNYVLYWEMIRDACERGFRHYHLGRSTADSGAESFKKKWNASARPLYWYYFLPRGGELPGLNPDNPKYRLAIRVWRRLPLAVTGLIGPWLARSIP